jgi:hypothetical protein
MDPTEALENRNRSVDAYVGIGEQKLFELWYGRKKTSSDGVSWWPFCQVYVSYWQTELHFFLNNTVSDYKSGMRHSALGFT